MANPLLAVRAPTAMLPPLSETDEPKRSLATTLAPTEASLTIVAALQPRQMPPVLLQGVPEGHAAQAAPPVPHVVSLWLA